MGLFEMRKGKKTVVKKRVKKQEEDDWFRSDTVFSIFNVQQTTRSGPLKSAEKTNVDRK